MTAASLYEIIYRVMLSEWPEIEWLRSMDLDARLRSDGFEVVPASGAMVRAGCFDWAHQDPFARIIVATALERALLVVSKDGSVDATAGEGH